MSFCLHHGVRLLLVCAVCLAFAACDTLENRRDLYSTDPYIYRPTVTTTTTVRETTTTTGPVEFRPHAEHE